MNKKNILIVIILILVSLFGFGLFYFLRFAKENMIEDKVIKLGDSVNEDINYYLKNNKNCTLDVSQVDTSKVGTYKYYVKCKRKTFEATIEVKK